MWCKWIKRKWESSTYCPFKELLISSSLTSGDTKSVPASILILTSGLVLVPARRCMFTWLTSRLGMVLWAKAMCSTTILSLVWVCAKAPTALHCIFRATHCSNHLSFEDRQCMYINVNVPSRLSLYFYGDSCTWAQGCTYVCIRT